MSSSAYFHGFSTQEQQRLIRQSAYWRETLLPLDLNYQPGDRVLEIGCAVGATLAELAELFPGISLAGVDREERQIEAAKRHLESRGVAAELLQADAASLPLPASSFDHVFIMWLVEHLPDPVPMLREAYRVLRPGGSIAVTETDYTTFRVTPESADWEYVAQAQYDYFAEHGNPCAGRELGPMLCSTGFERVRNRPVGFHFFQGGNGLADHVNYVCDFLSPGVESMASLGFDEPRLRRGLAHLRSVPQCEDGTFTQIIYRAHAWKA